MADLNRRFLLRERPTDRIGPDTFELVEEEVPEIGDGEALLRTEWMSLDPTNRTWIDDTPTYLPPVAIGECMRALGLARVVKSNHPGYEEGKLMQGLVGSRFLLALAVAVPGTLVGAGLGALLYRRLDDRRFDHIVLCLLLASGLGLVWSSR